MDALLTSGWNIDQDKLKALQQQQQQQDEQQATNKRGSGIKDVALNSDLKDFGVAWLADAVSAAGTGKADKVMELPSSGAGVLQVSRLRNVSAPKANEESGAAPRMLKITLTDGHSNVQALELKPFERLSLSATPPGTKVKLKGSPVLRSSFLLLEPGQLEILGGKVESLVEKWEISRKLAQFTRAKTSGREGGPPPWVAFGKRIDGQAEKGFKALKGEANPKGSQQQQQQQQDGEEGEDDGFDAQRKGAIEEASKQGGKKVFGGGTKEIKEGSKRRGRDRGPAASGGAAGKDEEAHNGATRAAAQTGQQMGAPGRPEAEPAESGRGRGGRGGRRGGGGRGRRGAGGDDDGRENGTDYSKPSQGVSLFDFLEEKFPDKSMSEAHEQPQPHQQSRGHVPAMQQGRDVGLGGRRGRGGGSVGLGPSRRAQQQHYEPDPSRRDRSNRDRDVPRNIRSYQQQQHQPSGRGNDTGRRGDQQQQRGGQRRQQHHGQNSQSHHHQQQQNPSAYSSGRSKSLMSGSDRDFGEWSNSTYHETQTQTSRSEGRREKKPHHSMQPSNPHHRDSSGWIDNFQSMSLNGYEAPPRRGGSQGAPPPPPVTATRWNVGDVCLAKYWEDGQYYVAKVTGLTENTAVVLYPEYGNHEEIMLTDMKPHHHQSRGYQQHQQHHSHYLQQQQQPPQQAHYRHPQNHIPATPGLPPAFPQS